MIAKIADAGQTNDPLAAVLRRIIDDLLLKPDGFGLEFLWICDTAVKPEVVDGSYSVGR